MKPAEFTCTFSGPSEPFVHFWKRCVGCGHSTLLLRADFQAQLMRCRSELGFERVRFHGMLMEAMGLVWREAHGPKYSFYNADLIVEFLKSIGMCPFLELSFMPDCFASGRKTVFHYHANVTPPRRQRDWDRLVGALLSHWVERFGVGDMLDWYFEVWNEPNLKTFWTSGKRRYLEFYKGTAFAVKDVDPRFRVGGPATSNNEWIRDFLDFCDEEKVPVDFVSTHQYPDNQPFGVVKHTRRVLSGLPKDLVEDQVRKVHEEADGKPIFYTEWSSSADGRDTLHDQSYASSFIIRTIMNVHGLVEGYSYWVFSDLFNESPFPSTPFHGGFGLMTVHGIPKPSYRAFQLLGALGDERLPVEGSDPTVGVWAVKDGHKLTLLLSNFALPDHELVGRWVRIVVEEMPPPVEVHVERIDDERANSFTAWDNMGRPEQPSVGQWDELQTASRMRKETVEHEYRDSRITVDLQVPPYGVAAVSITFSRE